MYKPTKRLNANDYDSTCSPFHCLRVFALCSCLSPLTACTYTLHRWSLLVPFHESKTSLRVAMYGCFYCLFRPVRSKHVCRLDGCSRPRFEEPANGRVHDFCGRSHAQAFDEQAWAGPNRRAGLGASHGTPAWPTPAGRLDVNQEYWTQEMVLFWQPPSMFSQWTPSAFVVDHVSRSATIVPVRVYVHNNSSTWYIAARAKPKRDRWEVQQC